MSSAILAGGASGSGSVTLQAPNTNNVDVINLPDTNGGTVMVSSNMPAFLYALSGTQNISSSTSTKIQIGTKIFDTANAYDGTTNYRFQPTVAGYYQISGGFSPYGVGAPERSFLSVFKNGSEYYRLQDLAVGTGGGAALQYVAGLSSSVLLYLNGSTDYVELWGWILPYSSTATISGNGTPAQTYFSGILVRTA